nr:unnamed protein product [Digitaria exilis]
MSRSLQSKPQPQVGHSRKFSIPKSAEAMPTENSRLSPWRETSMMLSQKKRTLTETPWRSEPWMENSQTDLPVPDAEASRVAVKAPVSLLSV